MRYIPGGILGAVAYLAVLFYLTGCASTCTAPYEGADYCYTTGACYGYECPLD